MKKALIIGSTVCDVIIQVHHYPQISGDENIIHQHLQLGGCAYNVAHILHIADIPCELFSPVGKGIYGQFVREHLKEEHIPILITREDHNGCCYCIVDDSSERTFICEHGTEYFYQQDDFNMLNMDDYDCIYVCGLEIEEKSGEIIIDFLEKNRDKVIYFAPGPRINQISHIKMQRILDLHPIMHLNKQEILSYTKHDDLDQAIISL
ncbi:MAG: PfkB family carbohydrate kinase, partial [Erysipelotrichaceae bacterium]|nr:PfkB family carbohydrate kinase [Erysipelotrichaceae bacterium]